MRKWQVVEKMFTAFTKKMVRKNVNFESLNDIYGFRVLVDNVDDCYRVLGVLHNHYKPIPGRFNDYIAIPKANGYQSLHTVVFGPFGDNIEIQIRTEAMHRIAESGVAAHWMYKSGETKANESVNLSRQWLVELLDPDRQSSNPAEFLEHLKTDLYADKVYVFTPKGAIKKLPTGATALDFAYAVHTGVGSKSESALVNGKPVPLSTRLLNGDHVEIVTNQKATPRLSWLSFAVTGRARSQIRAYFNSQSSQEALLIGKSLFKQALKKRSLHKRFISADKKQKVLAVLNIQSWDDLLIEIGRGHRIASLVLRQIFADELPAIASPDSEQSSVKIKGTEGILVTYSRCCCPIPGDAIAGTMTFGSGLVIHTLDCPNFKSMQSQVDQSVPVEWSDKIDSEFPVKMRIWVRNQRSMFAKVVAIIAEHGCNILDIETAESTDEFQPVDMIIDVKDRIHLAQVLKQLRQHEDVQKVQRQKG
jgi:guanosine-3',5'-bis(diphosphate) 3'-pyrophosphohydrolase